jgi:catechol 2,3-dioxygenase-like lactoylglutathione lyase family enzyme
MNRILTIITFCTVAAWVSTGAPRADAPAAAPAIQPTPTQGDRTMRLGNFSVSLAVKDLAASRAFYEKLGFRVIGGNGKNLCILQNDAATIGLFQGMFDKNILTFNPGWDRTGATLPEFDDVREIQRTLVSRGLTPATRADEAGTGPASIVVFDPDGNQILIDQHVPRPGR